MVGVPQGNKKINMSQRVMNSILCTICMRGGSQGVKNKHTKLINGKPLMYYTIKQAIKSKIFDKIVFSTDSKQIFKYAKTAEYTQRMIDKLESRQYPNLKLTGKILEEETHFTIMGALIARGLRKVFN